MANTFRSRRTARLLTSVVARPRLQLQQLEDRSVPSISIPLNPTNANTIDQMVWAPFGPSPVAPSPAGQTPSTPGNLTGAGRVVNVATHPTDPNIILAATAGGGIARTTDGGLTWTHTTDNLIGRPILDLDPPNNVITTLDVSLRMGAVTFAPTDGNIVYAGTGNWGFTDDYLVPLGQNQPGFSDLNYSGRGLLKSTDGGLTWSMIKGPGGAFVDTAIQKIVVHPDDANTVFVVTVGGNFPGDRVRYQSPKPSAVWRSFDGGLTWDDITANLANATEPPNGPQLVDRFRPITDFTLAVDPVTRVTAGYVAVGDPRLFIPGFGYRLNGVYRTPDVRLPDVSTINYVVAFGGNGTFIPGSSLGPIRVETAPSRPSTVYVLVAQPNTPAGGTLTTSFPQIARLGIFRSTEAGINFQQVGTTPAFLEGSGYSGYNMALFVDPQNENRLFIAGRGLGSRNTMFLSEDGGFSWNNVSVDSTGAGPFQVIRHVQFDSSRRVVVATDFGVYRLTVSSPTSFTWAAVNGDPGPRGLSASEVTGLALSPRSADEMIITSYGTGTARFQDFGDPVTGPLRPGDPRFNQLYTWPVTDSTRFGSDVFYDFVNPQTVYRAGSRNNETANGGTAAQTLVMRSDDGGLTWVARGAGIDSPESSFDRPAFELDPSNRDRLLFGTDVVNVSETRGDTWGRSLGGVNIPDLPLVTNVPTNYGNPGIPITKIGIGRFDPRIIYVAVQDRARQVNNVFISYSTAIYRIDLNFTVNPEPLWRDVSPGRSNAVWLGPEDPPTNPWFVGPTSPLIPGWVLPGYPAPTGTTVAPFGYPNALTGPISDITVDPNNSNVVVITVDTEAPTGRVWRTTNGGNTWTDITGDLGVPGSDNLPFSNNLRVYMSVIDPNQLTGPADDDIYVATEVGVWKLSDPDRFADPSAPYRWTRLGGNTGMPDVMVQELDINTTTGILAAGTFGRGVWQFQIRPLISGQVFEDLTGNGLRETTNTNTVNPPVSPPTDPPTRRIDPPVAGQTVLAFNLVENQENANTISRSNGFYEFRSLRNGDYEIRLGSGPVVSEVNTSPPGNFTFTGINQSTTVRTGDVGVFKRTSITGVLFDDTNGNGVRDAGEPGLAGRTVTLLADPTFANAAQAYNPVTRAKYQPISVTTGTDGSYTFTGLAPLQDRVAGFDTTVGYTVIPYVVSVVPPTGSIVTTGVPGSNASAAIRLISNTPVGGVELGEFKLATIRGRVFEDANANGVATPNEPALSGWTVYLDENNNGQRDAGEPTSVSDNAGNYSFANLPPTANRNATPYRVRLDLTNKATFTQTTVNPPDTFVTSGLDTGDPAQPALVAKYSFGVFRLASLSGTVYEDTNGDGLRQPDETRPIAQATVQLIDPGADPADPADDVVLATTTTDAGGGYTFTNLFPIGAPASKNTIPYLVRVVQPDAIFVQTSADRRVFLTSGINTGGQDLGYFRRTTISGFAFEDVNGNGVRDPGEPAQGNLPITLLNSGTLAVVGQTKTDSTGQYVFAYNPAEVPPGFSGGPLQAGGPGGAVVPYRVAVQVKGFEQTTADPGDIVLTSGQPAAGPILGLFRQVPFTGVLFDDLNGDGFRQANEPGLAGRQVQLVNAAGQVVRTTTTDANGNYLLNAGPGTFTARSVSPSGVIQTTADRPLVGTQSGLTIPPADIGSFTTVTVSGTVFDDANGNGALSAGEPPVGGATLRLVRVTRPDGTPDGTVVGTAVSAGTGAYSFPGVGPGTYQLQYVPPAGVYATTANPLVFTATSGNSFVQNVGTFRAVTVTGRVVETTAGTPGAAGFTVQLLNAAGQLIGTVPQVVTDANGSFTLTNVPQGPVTIRLAPRPGWTVFDPQTITLSPTSGVAVADAGTIRTLRKGSASGTVFADLNRSGAQEAIEPGRAGITVELVDATGAVVATATTGPDGRYAFFDRDPGVYTVRVAAVPAGQSQTSPRGGNFTYVVSLADGSTSPGNAVAGLDFGLIGRKRYALAADGGGGPRVQVYDATNGQLLRDTFVYEQTFTGGVRVASADVNGDGVDDLITAAGPGGGPRVRVLDGATGAVIYDYFAYEPSFRDGLFVTAGDVDGDGFADIITGTSPGGGPRVTVFSGRTGQQIADYFAYDPTFRGGVRVGAADVNGDGRAEVVTGPGVARDGTGLEPRVITWAFGSPGNPLRQFSSFLAFDPTYTGGVYVAGTSLDQGGAANVIVGSGLGFPGSATARVFNGASGAQFYEFPVFDGAAVETRVASFDANGDGIPELVFASGPGIPSRVQILDGKNRREIGNLSPFEPSFLGGVFIG